MYNLIKKRNSSRGGIIRITIYIVIILLILSYFGLNIRAIVNSPTGQENFTYVQELMIKAWDGYLEKPATYLWNDIFLDLIWNPAVGSLTKMKDGQADSFASSTPSLPNPQPIPQ